MDKIVDHGKSLWNQATEVIYTYLYRDIGIRLLIMERVCGTRLKKLFTHSYQGYRAKIIAHGKSLWNQVTEEIYTFLSGIQE